MGYYSDVAIAMRKKDLQQMMDEALKLDDDKWTYSFIKEGLLNAPDCSDGDYVYLHWVEVKWHDTNKEVSFIKHFLNSIQNDHYDFFRLGDEYDDIEYFLGTGECLLHCLRDIDFNN